MKPFVLSIAVVVAVFLNACDKIKYPIEKSGETVTGTSFIYKDNSAIAESRKVLLEDYTGHTCGNCPAAAEVAHQLAEQHGNKLVLIAVHAGFFARLKNPDYTTSYTTTVGNDWDGSNGFGISAAGNPNGMVNRKAYDGSRIQKETKWPSSVASAVNEPLIVTLNVNSEYDTTVRALNVLVRAKFKSAYQNNVKLSVVYTEDEVIGHQLDYRKKPELVSDYHFEHMLRGSVNGSWGEILKSGPVAANDTVQLSYKNFKVPEEFNDRNIGLVVFAFDETTKEVIQAEYLKIR